MVWSPTDASFAGISNYGRTLSVYCTRTGRVTRTVNTSEDIEAALWTVETGIVTVTETCIRLRDPETLAPTDCAANYIVRNAHPTELPHFEVVAGPRHTHIAVYSRVSEAITFWRIEYNARAKRGRSVFEDEANATR